jgi:hypothetical protein
MSYNRSTTVKTEITGQNGFPSKGTLPKGRTLSGTFSSNGKIVTGTGTAFTTELGGMKGWLYSTADNELRAFTQINGDDVLYLDTAFTNNQSGQPVIVCTPLYRSIGARSSHASNPATLNNRTFTAGQSKSYNFPGGVDPISYNAASGALSGEITFELGY